MALQSLSSNFPSPGRFSNNLQKFFISWYFQIWCHLTEMNVDLVMMGCIWLDPSWFLRHPKFSQVLSSFSLHFWMMEEKLKFLNFLNPMSIERGRDYMINDPTHMTVWWFFSEIWLFKIFTPIFSWSQVPQTLTKIFWISIFPDFHSIWKRKVSLHQWSNWKDYSLFCFEDLNLQFPFPSLDHFFQEIDSEQITSHFREECMTRIMIPISALSHHLLSRYQC